MYTKQQRREIYFTAYCCLDGEECDLTDRGICNLIYKITGSLEIYDHQNGSYPELRKNGLNHGGWIAKRGSPGWPQRKEILIKAMELTYKK